MTLTLMIVNDFNAARAFAGPTKTNPVLVIDPDAVLAKSVTLQRFQAIARRCPEKPETGGRMQLSKLAPDDGLDTDESPHPISFKERFGLSVCERNNHKSLLIVCR
jgi:hypothetical protein